MERIRTQRAGEEIARALALVPGRVLELVGTDHFEGDPYFAGVYGTLTREEFYELVGVPGSWDGGPQSVAARAVHMRAPRTIAYLSRVRLRPAIVLHELGHAVEHVVWERGGGPPPRMAGRISDRGGSYGEWFAEAFVTWLLPPRLMHAAWDARYAGRVSRFYLESGRRDNRELLGLFNELAGWPVDRRPPATDGCWP